MTRIAVVGAGLIGQKHIDVVRAHAELDAIIDPSEVAKDLSHHIGTNWFASVDRYLEHNRPDGAIIATPNQLHQPHGAAFIETGVPVLIEKPLAGSTNAAAELAELSKQTDVPILVGHHRRHSSAVKATKAAIDVGELGRLVTINAQFWLFKPIDYFDVTWRKQEGAGPTFVNLIHDIDLLRHFCGEVASVQAIESSTVRKFEVEDTSVAILEFESGVLGTVSISDTVVAPWSWELTAGENPAYPKTEMSCYMIGGTKGSLSIPDLTLWQHPGTQSWWAPIEPNKLGHQPSDPIVEQFLHFLDIIETGCAPLVSAEEGMKNIQVLNAIKNAALHGGTEPVG